MRILQNHVDYINYKPIKKEIYLADEVKLENVRFEEIIVLFLTVENGDNKIIGENAIKDVKLFLDKQKVKKILIYPFAHLSRDLAKPRDALDILNHMEKFSKENGIETYRAPFGWNKSMEIKIKGHPLAETFKVYNNKMGEKVEQNALKSEEKLKSNWYILDNNGKLNDVNKFDFKNNSCENLKRFADYEISKSRNVHQTPAHITLMKKLEIADNESGSDSGNLKYMPKGRIIKNLLENWIGEKIANYGGMEVETPIMYDYDHPALKKYLERFPARQYIVNSSKKDYFMRFSACFGQFLMMANSNISYKNLPMKIYELAKYAFRLEKTGELAGLRRLRCFTMPDMHTLCSDLEMSKKEFINQFKLCMECMEEIEINNYETAIRFTENFWKENKEFIISLMKILGKPVLIEIWNTRFAYFDPKFEFNFVDYMGKAGALSTVQLDHENAERFGIKYIDKKNTIQKPYILHTSPSGAIERVMYAILENANINIQNKKPPSFPLWLSPTQVRLIPLSEKFEEYVEKIANEIENNKIRVDIDDRIESVQKRIRQSELEWIPFVIVIGEKEIESNNISLRERSTGKNSNIKLDILISKIKENIKNKPFRKLNLPRKLSNRPNFGL